MVDWLAYLALGALVGILAGLLGIGGGLFIVATLVYLLSVQGVSNELNMHLAVGTSQATIVITSLAAIRAHHRRQGILWAVIFAMAPGLVAGAFLGAFIASALSGPVLKGLFSVFALLIAGKMGSGFRPMASRPLPQRWVMAGAGTVIGTVSALFGIGGGSLTVPYLSWHSVSMRRAVGTASACGFLLAASGTCGFIWAGWNEPGLPAWSSGYVYWPAVLGIVTASTLLAPVGAGLAYRLNLTTLKTVFAVCLGGVGLYMLLEWFFYSPGSG